MFITTSEMWQLLARAEVVINIHYYFNAPLEQFRICEALSFGCHVVSEHSVAGDELFNEIVSFGDIKKLASLAKSIRGKPFNYSLEQFNNLNQVERGLELL